jgi:hypothetical protein
MIRKAVALVGLVSFKNAWGSTLVRFGWLFLGCLVVGLMTDLLIGSALFGISVLAWLLILAVQILRGRRGRLAVGAANDIAFGWVDWLS